MKNNSGLRVGDLMVLAVVALLAVVCSGCKTVSTTSVDSSGATNTVTITELDPLAGDGITAALEVGLPFAIKADANAVPYLRLVANAFSVAANSGQYDPAAVEASLSKISIRELRDPLANDLTQMALNAYRGLWAKHVNGELDKFRYGPFFKELLTAIADGINGALPAQ